MNTKKKTQVFVQSAMLFIFSLPPQSLRSHPLLVHPYPGRLELRDAPVSFQHTKIIWQEFFGDPLRAEVSWRREHPKFKWIFNTFLSRVESSRPCFLAIWCNISPTQGFRCSSFSLSQLMCTHSQKASLLPDIPSDCSSAYSEFLGFDSLNLVWSERKQWWSFHPFLRAALWSGWLKRQATRRRRRPGGGEGGGCRRSLRLRPGYTSASTGINVVPQFIRYMAVCSVDHDTS